MQPALPLRPPTRRLSLPRPFPLARPPPPVAPHPYYAAITFENMHAFLTQHNADLAHAVMSQLRYDVTKDAAYFDIAMTLL